MRRYAWWLAAGPLALGLNRSSALAPGLVERLYSRGVFPLVARGLSFVSGLFPFSLAELTVALLALLLVSWIAAIAHAFRRRPAHWKQALLRQVALLLSFLSVAYAGFVILWGLNYNRQPFGQVAGITPRSATVGDLAGLCGCLVARADSLREIVKEDSTGVMRLGGDIRETLRRAALGYDVASQVYPVLEGPYSSPKGVFVSPLWSYTGIGGAYWPYTGEANVNTAVPASSIPATACHEMAHQRGFAREDEANFIAYVACRSHPDADFQYSGAILALSNAMSELRRRDPEAFALVRTGYSAGVRRDLAAADAFWRAHEGPVERFSNRVNDQYLKANRQSEGVESYGRMVDLLLAEYLEGRL